MKLLLIVPRKPPRCEIKDWTVATPLGICYIASALQSHGHNVKIIDPTPLGWDLDRVVQESLRYKPDIIGISSSTPAFGETQSIASAIKSYDNTIDVVVGGPHISFTAEEEMKKCHEIDYAVLGEGEETIVELAKRISEGFGLKNVKGIAYRKNGKIVLTKKRPLLRNLDELPFPARNLLPINKYPEYTRIGIVATRGCPFYCSFCVTSEMNGHFLRKRSIDLVVDELEDIHHNYPTRAIEFEDDCFAYDHTFTRKLCKEIIERKLYITWNCEARVTDAKKENLILMKKAGCDNIFFGVESGSQDTLNKLGKGILLEDSIKAVKNAIEVGIDRVVCGFVIGFPWEDTRQVRQTIQFAKKLRQHFGAEIAYSFLMPFPGTRIRRMMEDVGICIEKNYDLYFERAPVASTQYLTKDELGQLFLEFVDILQ